MTLQEIYNYMSVLRMEGALLLLLIILLVYKVAKGDELGKAPFTCIQFSLLLISIAGFVLPVTAALFGGMFNTSALLSCQKGILSLATFIILLQASDWLKKHPNAIEFYMLIISVLMGTFFMISSGHFLLFYLGLELATIPLAALVTFDFEKRRSSEAGVKMILSSAFSSAILLFGISLIYGFSGSLYFNDVALKFSAEILPMAAFAFLIAGFAFKISAVPFHLWTADVYEGAPVPVTSFLSVVSKGAALFIFITALFRIFGSVAESWIPVISIMALVTMTLGNLMALRQDNLKRFLAFSSITQVGYVLVGIASAGASGHAAVIYFILIYIFSNVAAFTVVGLISEKTGKETISSYASLYKSNPVLAVIMMLAVFSLAGIPPTAGFFGKLFLLSAGAQSGMVWVLVIACLNMVISLYYYLRVVRSMFVDKTDDPASRISINWQNALALGICIAGILAMAFVPFVFEDIFKLAFGL